MAPEDELPDVLQKARFGLGLSLAEAARRAALSEDALAEIEEGRRTPGEDEVARLAAALGLQAPALQALIGADLTPSPLPLGWVGLKRTKPPLANAWLYLGAVRILVDAGVPLSDVTALTDRLDAVFLTHEHHDHIESLKDLRARFSPRVFGHAELGLFLPGVEAIADGQEVFGLTAIATPGHSPLGLSFWGYGAVATGDAVYARSIGRAETPAAYPTSLKSLARILALPPETVLLPGHGPATTVGAERSGQPFVPPALSADETPRTRS